MTTFPTPQSQYWDEEVIGILKRLGSLEVEYPSKLLVARRAAFIRQVEQKNTAALEEKPNSEEPFIKHLESMSSVRAEYPPELLAARRADFVDQIKEYSRAETTEELHPSDQEIFRLFKSLKSVEAEYPAGLLSARRMAFQRQIALGGRVSVLDAVSTYVRRLFLHKIRVLSVPAMSTLRTSLVVLVLMLAAFGGSLLGRPAGLFEPVSLPAGVFQPGSLSAATSTAEVAKVICKPGYLPPLCLAKEFDKSQDLTFPGNGSARPAVAKDTLPGYDGVHKAAYLNDGLYGPGASWVSNSPYSWIKIDLGKTTTVNTVAFGKDRLGNFRGGDPGQFVIAVALNDNVYADGNSSNDYTEYTEIYNSTQTGFNGTVSGSETIKAQFRPVTARFIKITFANAGTAVDEVEAYLEHSVPDGSGQHKGNPPGNPPTSVPASTSTSRPPDTAIPLPTDTPVPPDTATPVPTNPPEPTNTPVPPPTNTPAPPPTDTPAPPPADTPVPPQPTDIPAQPTEIVQPPTEQPLPPPAPIGAIEPLAAPTAQDTPAAAGS